jgi:hypothetical protein
MVLLSTKDDEEVEERCEKWLEIWKGLKHIFVKSGCNPKFHGM